jgi:hypothetical protein
MKYAGFVLAGFILLGATASVAADFALTPAHSDYGSPPPAPPASPLETQPAAGYIGVSWHDVERSEGNFVLDPLLRRLKSATGKPLVLGIAPLDAEGRRLPADISRAAWGDAGLIDRFHALVDKIAATGPRAPAYIAVGEDADVYLQAHPDETLAFLGFYRYACLYLRGRFPNAKIGIGVSAAGLAEGRGQLIARIIGTSDVAMFSDYPVAELKGLPPEKIGAGLEALIASAGKKPVLLLKAGYPPHQVVLPDAAEQAAFFRAIAASVAGHPRIVYANLVIN